MSNKFNYCYESDGLMWCQFSNGKWAHPFPATNNNSIETKISKPSKKKITRFLRNNILSN